MAEAFTTVNGVRKRVSDVFVAHNGVWKRVSAAYLATSGVYKSAFSNAPTVSITAAATSNATWSRITYSVTVTGVWKYLDINLVRVEPTYSVVYTQRSYTATPSSGLSISLLNQETALLTPTHKYRIEVQWQDSSNVVRTAGQSSLITLTKPPLAKNVVNKTPITDVAGGKQWTSSRDIDDWQSKNLTLGTTWNHGGDKPYIYYDSGLTPSKTYTFQTRSHCNGVYGDWSPDMSFTTLAPQYTPGSYYIWPYAADTYDDSYGWQGASRDYWYHGYYSSNRGVQRACAWFNMSDATLATVRSAINKGATITGAWLLLGRPNTANGSVSPVPVVYSLLMSAPPPASPIASTGNIVGGSLARGSVNVSIPVDKGWVKSLVLNKGNTGFMLGNTNASQYYMALEKTNFCRLRVDIA